VLFRLKGCSITPETGPSTRVKIFLFGSTELSDDIRRDSVTSTTFSAKGEGNATASILRARRMSDGDGPPPFPILRARRLLRSQLQISNAVPGFFLQSYMYCPARFNGFTVNRSADISASRFEGLSRRVSLCTAAGTDLVGRIGD
jgi:hypothetical protein